MNIKSPASRLAKSLALSLGLLAAILFPQSAQAATKTFNSGATTLDTVGNWTTSGIPATGDEALIDTTNSQPATTLSTAQTFGDLLINNSTLNSISLTGITSAAITLSGGGGSTAAIAAGGAAGDLLLLGTNVTGTVTIGGGSGTGKLGLSLGADGNIDVVNSGATANITGILAGAFNLTKTGAGTLTLSGVNTFGAGKTFTLSAGTLNVNSTTALGSATTTFQINGGTTINNTSGAAITTINANPITINGDFTFAGGGSGTDHDLTFKAAGAVNLNAGTRTITTTASNSTLGFLGIISNGGILKTGAGSLLLSGANTFADGLTIQAGTVKLGATAGAGAGNVTLGVAGDATSGALDLNGGSRTIAGILGTAGTAANQTITSTVAGGILNYTGGTTSFGGIIAGGANTAVTLGNATTTLTLSGANTYSGNTTVSTGTLVTSGTNSSAGGTTVSSAVLTLNNASNGGLASGTLTLNNGTLQALTAAAGTLSNAVTLSTGSGGFNVGGSQSITLNGDVTFTGQTNKGFVNGMTGGAILTLNGAFLNLSAPTTNIYLSSGAGSTVINSVIRTVGGGGPGSLAVSAGALTLTNANTYNGTTTLSGGTLQLNNTSAISSSALVMSAGTLNLRSDTNNDTFGTASTTISASTAINVDRLSTGSANTLKLGAVNVTAATTATLTVSGGNSYGLGLGAITQSPTTATTLTIANSAPLTLASFTTSSTATPKLSFTGTGTATITGNLTQSGSGALALDRATAAGTLILQGTSNMAGAVTISTGTIQTSVATNAFGSTSGISIGSAGILALRGDATAAFGNGTTAYPISLSASGATINVDQVSSAAAGTVLSLGTVNMTGAYTLNITGANGVSLALGAITNGTVSSSQAITIANSIAAPGTLTIASIAYPSNNVATTGTISFSGSGTTIVSGAITQNLGAVALTQNNASGTTILTGNNTNTGNNTITLGTLQVGNNTTTGALGAGAVTDSGSLVFKRSDAISVSNNITSTGTVTQAGGSSLTLSGTSTFSGGLNINSGSVISGSATTNGGIGTGTVTMANSTTLDLGNNTITTGLLSTSGDGTGVSITNLTGAAGVKTLTINGTGTQTFAGVISNGTAASLGLTKAGTGIQNLTGANTYNGTTTLSATGGTLGFAAGSLTTTSGITLNSATTLKYLGSNNTLDLSGKTTIAGASTIDIGSNSQNYASAITHNTNVTLTLTGSIGSVLTFSGSSAGGLTSSSQPLVFDTIEVDLNKSVVTSLISATTVRNGATFKLFSDATGSLSTTSNAFTLITGGTLNLNGNSFNLGVLAGDSTGLITNSSGTAATVRFVYAGTAAYAGTIQDGTGAVAINFSPARAVSQTFSGNNTYTGGTTIAGDGTGTHQPNLYLGSNTALGNGTVTIGALSTLASDSVTARSLANNVVLSGGIAVFGTATNTGNLSFGALSSSATPTVQIDNGQTTFTSLSSTNVGAALTKNGTGALLITGNGSVTGATAINAGLLAIGGTSTLTGNVTLGGGVLGGNGSFSKAVGTGAGQVKFTAATNNGFAGYGGDLAVNLGGAGAIQTFGASSFLSSGSTLILGHALATGTADFQNGLDLAGATQTVQVDKGSAAVDGKISGIISNGSLTKTGAGTLALTAGNTYTGNTTVTSGTLLINGSTSTSSAVTVNSGGTIGGSGVIGGSLTLAGGDLKPGNSPGLLTAGSLILNSGTTTMEINNTGRGSAFDAIDVTLGGSVQFGGALVFSFGNSGDFADNTSFSLFSFNTTSAGNFSGVTSTGWAAYSGLTWGLTGDDWSAVAGNGQTLSFSELTGTLNVVPEPATWALLAFSLTTVMVLRRRRKD